MKIKEISSIPEMRLTVQGIAAIAHLALASNEVNAKDACNGDTCQHWAHNSCNYVGLGITQPVGIGKMCLLVAIKELGFTENPDINSKVKFTIPYDDYTKG